MIYSIYTVLLFVIAIMGFLGIWFSWNRRQHPGAKGMMAFSFVVAWWSLCDGLSAISPNEHLAFILESKLRFGAVAAAPVIILVIAFDHTGQLKKLSPPRLMSLFFIPILTQLIIWFGPTDIFIPDVQYSYIGGLYLPETRTFGLWFYIYSAYSYILILISFIILLNHAHHSIFLYRRQTLLLCLGLFISVMVSILRSFAGSAFLQFDWIALSITFTFLIWSYAIFQYGLLDFAPIAHQTVFDSIDEIIIVLDTQNRITDFNLVAQDSLNWTRNEAICKPITEMLTANQRAIFEQYADAEDNQGELVFENRIFDFRIISLYKDRNKRIGRLFILRDTTEHKKLIESMQKLSSAVHHSPVSIVITDAQGSIEFVNPAFTEITGYTSDEVIGENPRIFQSGQTSPNDYGDLWKTIKSGGTWQGELLNKKKNDELYWESISISPVKNTEGVITHFVGIKEDVTHRKLAEAARQDSYDNLMILQRVDTELSRKLDVQYVIERGMDAAIRLSRAETGIIGIVSGDEIQVVGAIGNYSKNIDFSLPQDTGIIGRVMHQKQPEIILDVNSDPDYVAVIPETRSQMTIPLMSQNKLLGVLSLETKHPELFGGDTFDFMKLLSTRISLALDNAYAYDLQVKLAEDLDAFAHTVAHDLKNPLNIILGYADLWLDDFTPKTIDEAQSYIGKIQQSSLKMNNIIDELLLLASVRKLEHIELAPLDMKHIIDGSLSRLTLLIEKNQAKITLSEPDIWPVALGYAGWVEEVWTNYISNAIKYGGTPPVIELGATLQDDRMIRFWVKDNGEGIEPELQGLIFNKLTRLAVTKAEGHGLGLEIVQRIVEKLGGQVAIESTVGSGSIFSFTLPPVKQPTD